jgi:hypothetical protein
MMAKKASKKREELELDLPVLDLDDRQRNFDSFAREWNFTEKAQVG